MKIELLQSYIKGKRFLITQPTVCDINGSTMAALELAEYLMACGARVAVYTYFLKNPARTLFEDKEIPVYTDANDKHLTIGKFDYVWVHSQVLPIRIIKGLSRETYTNKPKFIFFHMSGFEWASDERPYIYNLEDRLSSLSLYITARTRSKQKEYLKPETRTAILPNFSPIEYSQLPSLRSGNRLKHVAVVSNHMPDEMKQAIRILKRNGLDVKIFGGAVNKQERITAEKLKRFDLVVSIGKTVQYCLTAGIPVYIYDHFGGGGYLDEKSFRIAASRNFTGREGARKRSEYIYNDIVTGYDRALYYHIQSRSKFIRKYSIENILPRVLSTVESKEIKVFSKRYASAVISAQILSAYRFKNHKQKIYLNVKLIQHQKKHKLLKEEIESIKSSGSYAFGRTLLFPLRMFKKPFSYTRELFM